MYVTNYNRMNSSSSFKVLNSTKILERTVEQEFLDFHCSWSKTRAFVQLQAYVSQLTVDNRPTKLQSLNYFYNGKVKLVC
jgi:hypothetical protein